MKSTNCEKRKWCARGLIFITQDSEKTLFKSNSSRSSNDGRIETPATLSCLPCPSSCVSVQGQHVRNYFPRVQHWLTLDVCPSVRPSMYSCSTVVKMCTSAPKIHISLALLQCHQEADFCKTLFLNIPLTDFIQTWCRSVYIISIPGLFWGARPSVAAL